MKTLVVVTSLLLGSLASSAFAADVSIKGNASETVSGSDNYFMSNAPSGPTGETLSAMKLDVLAQTPTTQYLLDGNYSYYKYFGPGAADTQLTWGTPASATFSIDHTTELTKYNLATSWTRTDATTTQLAQSGIATAHGSINTYAINGGATRDLGRINSLSWTAAASTVSFTDPTQTPYVDLKTSLAWNHSLTHSTTITNAVSFDWFSEDNTAKSQRLFWTVTTGLQSQLTQRLTLGGHVGLDFANSYQNGEAESTNPSSGFQPQVGAGHGWLADVALTYKLLKTTTATLTAAHTTIPLFTGQLQTSDTIGLSVNHDINQFSNLTFSTQFAQTLASQGNSLFGNQSSSSDFFSASVNYGYRLTREWRTNLTYTYSQRNDDTGIARSNTILVALSRDFNVLGNPTAIDQAEKERVKQRAQNTVGYVFPTFP